MTKIKTNQVPGRAKYLFIKLYCEKRGGETSENIHTAAQSWLSLSHRKKEHFYETVSTKSAIKKAQRIIQTEPFLRTKFPSISRKRKRKHSVNKKQQNNGHNSEVAATDDNMSLHDDTIMECDSYSNSFVGDDNVDDKIPDTSTRDKLNIVSASTQDIDSTLQERIIRCESQPVSNETQPVDPPLQTKGTALQEKAEELTTKFPSISRKRKRKHSDSKKQWNNEHNSEVAATDHNMLPHDDTIMKCDSYSNLFVGDDVNNTQPDTSTREELNIASTSKQYIDSTAQERTERFGSLPVSNETQPVAPPLQTEDTMLQERTEELTSDDTLPDTSTRDELNIVSSSTQYIDSTAQERTERCESQPASNEPQICDAEKQQNSFMNIIDDEDTLSATEIFDEETEKVPLLEPVLPIAKSGRHLFELLNSRNGSTKGYESLTGKEKNFYGHAVRKIKRDYVQKYKEYLESLTSRELFDYYRKVFFN